MLHCMLIVVILEEDIGVTQSLRVCAVAAWWWLEGSLRSCVSSLPCNTVSSSDMACVPQARRP